MVSAFITFWSHVPVRWRLLLNVVGGIGAMSVMGLGIVWLALQDLGRTELFSHYALLWCIGSGFVMVFMVGICEFVVWDINRAIRGLTEAMVQLNDFNMQVQAPLEGQYEVVDVARRLNVMVNVWRSLLGNVSNAILKLQGTSDGLKAAAGTMHHLGDAQRSDMGELNVAADNVARMALDVEKSAQQMGVCASRITDISGKTGQAVTRLSVQSQAVGEMSDLIQTVAENINLLALNASIEAARAGDAGLGFAVVAQEVRKLSQETSKMAIEIRNKVEALDSVVDEVTHGEDAVKEYIVRIREGLEHIVVATTQQSQSASEMAQGVARFCDRLDELAKRIADADQAAHQVADNSHALQTEASRFRT